MTTINVDPSMLLIDPPVSAAPGPDTRSAFHGRFEWILTGLEVIADWLTIVVAVIGGYVAYRILGLGERVEYPIGTFVSLSFGMATFYTFLLDRDGAYRCDNSLLRIKETERSLRISIMAFLLLMPISFFSRLQFSRWVFLFAMISVPILQVMEKQLLFVAVRALRSRGLGVKRVLIYGAGFSGRRVFSALVRSPKLGLHPVVMVDDDPSLEGREVFESGYRHEHSVKVVSAPIGKRLIEQYRCDFVIVAIPSLSHERFTTAVAAAHAANVQLAYLPGQAVTPGWWIEHADIDGLLLSVATRPSSKWQYETAKRLFDLSGSFLLIVALAPIWLITAMLVKFDSPGPVLFRQKRVGKNGRLFDMYKFRSMIVEAPQYGYSPRESADPRITRVGRLLRRTSIDELPQLLNVVKGDMSLVGPRPEMPFIVRHYNPQQRQRLQVTPGITGLWQLSADRAYLIHENIEYDLYYIRNRSFFMDFAILLHTLIFAMRGI